MHRSALIFTILLAYPSIVAGHSGRTDANGGHHDRKNGGYHYHNAGPSNSRSTRGAYGGADSPAAPTMLRNPYAQPSSAEASETAAAVASRVSVPAATPDADTASEKRAMGVEATLASFRYQGVKLGESVERMLQLIPEAKLNDDHQGADRGIITYEVWNDPANDCVLLRFVDNALLEVDYVYFPYRVAREGGFDALMNKSISKLGPPATQTDKTRLWDFPDVNRMIIAFQWREKWSLHVFDRSRRLAMTNYVGTTVRENQPPLYAIKATYVPPPSITPLAGADSRDTVGPRRPAKTAPMPAATLARIKQRASNDHPDDYSTRVFVINGQIEAYHKLRAMEVPQGMPPNEFWRMADAAARDHPYDFSTQHFVLVQNVESYYEFRQIGNSGDSGIHIGVSRH